MSFLKKFFYIVAGGKAVAAICSAEDGDAIVKVAMEKFGGVHVLIANAGILRDKSFTAMTEKEWDIVLAVHLRLVFPIVIRDAHHHLELLTVVHTRYLYSLSLIVWCSHCRSVRQSCLADIPAAEVRPHCNNMLTGRNM
jgi:NAD(P)-dependent dehydrogenase (short-subunit alcohol dehydrogenase family)